MVQWIYDTNERLLDLLWGPYMLFFFLFAGLFFSIGTGFFQLRHIHIWLKYTFCSLFKKEKNSKSGLSHLQTLSTTLAATVGTGNITGVAAALVTGGPGAIFWMWVSAFLGMMTAYAENVLTILYRQKDKAGNFIGGAMLYIEKGLRSRFLALAFSLFCIFASFGMGNMAQMHSISSALSDAFHIPAFWTGVFTSILIAFIITGGLSRIAKITEKLVPFMVILYFIGSFICLFACKDAIIPSLSIIIKSALSPRSAAGGVFGHSIMLAMRTGISRGVFSNEAGLGSATFIHASSAEKEPVILGMWGIFEVFVDTIVVCTLTALVILTSGIYVPGQSTLTGVQLTAAAYGVGLGSTGSLFISVSIVFFAFATVLGWSYFGERSVSYLLGDRFIPYYKVLYVLISAIGAWSSMELVWGISDVFNALMAIPNLSAILLLSGKVFRETRRFI